MDILKRIAPLSFELLGEEFFQETIPLYFKEIINNEDSLVENFFYFPLYFKKNQKKFKSKFSIPSHALELMDFEFTKFIIQSETSNQATDHIENPTEVYLNPIAQAMRHEHDVQQKIPNKNKTLVLISKNPKTNEIVILKGNIHHAAIIDELHDGKMAKKVLLHILQTQHPNVSPTDWTIAYSELRSNHFILES